MRPLFRLTLATILVVFVAQVNAADLKKFEQDLSDSVISTKITTKFTKNKNLNPLKLHVSTEDGVVTLRGYVNDNQAFVDALRLAKTTKGVTSVEADDLEIKQVNTPFTDAYITAKVETAVLKAKILDDESIPLVGINASTLNGVVSLSGTVKNSNALGAILKRVYAVRGVKKIILNPTYTTFNDNSKVKLATSSG